MPRRRLAAPTFALCSAACLAWPAVGGPLGYWDALVARQRDAWLAELRPAPAVRWFLTDGTPITRQEWRGTLTSILADEGFVTRDPVRMRRVLDQLDHLWLTLRTLAGDSPASDPRLGRFVGRRAILLETGPGVPMGDPSATALITVEPATLDALLAAANETPPAAPLGRQVPMQLARTFFFFDDALGRAAGPDATPLVDGFARMFAAHAAESIGWTVPAEPTPLEAIVTRYADDPEARWENTLAMGRGHGDADATALWTALLAQIATASGRADFARRLWRASSELPPAERPEDAVANLIVATSFAAGTDLTATFRAWRFPVTDLTRQRVRERIDPVRLRVPRS
jgi:hypothetical protein